MAERYDPSIVEPKWQRYWRDNDTFRTPDAGDGPRAYILDMFPYPSGAGLHVGHPEGYTATDIVARYKRACGVQVLHPMGWDAFGLPAEQRAIETGAHPAETTAANIATFRRQLQMLGFSYDWSREVDTTDPGYVKWTQWIFLELFERGLAYQSEVSVNWCPALGTVLANEEVKDGLSERGDHPVERRPLRQWVLKITEYADRLLEDLAEVEWPNSTRVMQTEWIGRSDGALVRFALEGDAGEAIEVFTTRPDTLFGATFMAIAPEHPLVDRLTTDAARPAVQAYVAAARNKSDRERQQTKEKSGVFTGGYAINPVNAAKVPVWVADYVLYGYGTGAIMAVPAHDERDFGFAKAYGIPIVEVVSPEGPPTEAPLSEPFVAPGFAVRSGKYDGLATAEFKARIIDDLEARGAGERRVEYKLRDWVFSRQRYWGEPIPIYFPVDVPDGGDPRRGAACTIRYDEPIAMRRDELPLRLPELDDYRPGDDPQGVLARATDWRFFERDGRWYARETNTMPQWAGSCWYFLRFTDPHNDEAPWSPEAAARWLPVDLYVGGAEHAVLHLLYARFWHKVLFDAGLVPVKEPFAKLVHQGMILGEVEYTGDRDEAGVWVSAPDVARRDGVPVRASDGATLEEVRLGEAQVHKDADGGFVLEAALAGAATVQVESRAHKMSKSRGNVVNPDDIVRAYGADAMRVYEMFMGPLEATKPWNAGSIAGVKRFIDRVWAVAVRACAQERDGALDEATLRLLHKTIAKVTEDIEAMRFNTAISAMMVLTNELGRLDAPPREAVATLAQLVHPFAPHLAEEVWEALGRAPSVQAAPWPEADPALCEDPEVEVPVQVNGKVRGRVLLPKDAPADVAVAAGRALPTVAAQLEGKTLRKTIWVPGKILNFIAR